MLRLSVVVVRPSRRGTAETCESCRFYDCAFDLLSQLELAGGKTVAEQRPRATIFSCVSLPALPVLSTRIDRLSIQPTQATRLRRWRRRSDVLWWWLWNVAAD